MAINKRKILQSAQKHMQKGALEKALKDYMALLKADPKDANLRLKVGDIHLKQGKTEDAVAAYRKVADQFMNDGFDAKAVAIFKQVTKIDPKRFDIYLPLSELYQRMGLTSEAMRALQTAADGAYREGDKDQALDLLRKMAALDPSNTTNRLKVAELLIQEERNEEAVTEFAEVASELERQGDAEEQLRVLERMLEVGSVGRDEKLGVGQVALTVRRFDLAIEIGQALTDLDPGDADAYELLGSGYDGAGQVEQRTAIYTKLAEIYRERGDDDLARDVIQRFGGDSVFGSGTSEDPVLAGSEDPVEIGSDDPELSDPGFTTGDGLVIGEPISDLADAAEVEEAPEEASASGLPPLPEIDEPEADASPAVDPDAAVGDPEQLLAEASVYLRYGKRERALESLRSILSSAPEHPDALAKLIEAIDDPSDPEQADAQARLDALQGASPAVEPEEAPALETDAEFDIEIDDDLDDEITLDDETGAPVDAEPVEAAPVEVEAADAADEIEIDLDAGSEDVLFDADADPVMLEPADGGLDADDADALGANADEAIALDSDAADAAVADLAGDDDVEIDLDDTPIESAGAAEAVSLDAADAAPLGAEDEIDFEFDDPTDGDDGDAAADVEAGAADEVELGDEDDAFEIDLDAEADEAPLAADPAEEAGLESGGDEVGIEIDLDAESVELSPDAEVAAELDIASEPELDAEDEDDTDEAIAANLSSERRSASLTTPAQVVEDLEEADFYFEQGMFTEAREIYERIVAGAPNHPQALLRLGEIDAAEGGAPGEAPAVPDVAAQAPEDAGVAADRAGDEIEVGDPMDLDEAADDAVPIDASNEAADEVGLDASALGFDGADASGEADVPEIGDIGEIEELDDEAIPEEDTSPTDAAVAVESIDPVLGDDPETLDAAAAERTPLRPTDAEAEITAPALDEDLEDGLDDDTLEGITPPSESEALDDAASADAVDVPEDAEPVADEPALTAADVAPVADEAPPTRRRPWSRSLRRRIRGATISSTSPRSCPTRSTERPSRGAAAPPRKKASSRSSRRSSKASRTSSTTGITKRTTTSASRTRRWVSSRTRSASSARRCLRIASSRACT